MRAQWTKTKDNQYVLKIGNGLLQIYVDEYEDDISIDVYGDAEEPLAKWADSITLDAAKLEAVHWAKEWLELMVKECEDALDNANKETPDSTISPEA